MVNGNLLRPCRRNDKGEEEIMTISRTGWRCRPNVFVRYLVPRKLTIDPKIRIYKWLWWTIGLKERNNVV